MLTNASYSRAVSERLILHVPSIVAWTHCLPQAATDFGSIEHVRHTQVFAECTSVQDMVGMANGGISSDIAKFMHRKQGVYG